ncbi:uncharacterized protein JN550_012286 [Neoarthrinium moseri]|uniref:uncharacterized protein n=1 Tax=Neoarthrinium moseri TaxID=1658444 RepID=UPI001FDC96FE|nr:uncharacterized protein JN550_012286 [Neoarthrinium moseri]KAI1858928.1 hypothetical protein JN550_012286 [Neoarthrinium moseri]
MIEKVQAKLAKKGSGFSASGCLDVRQCHWKDVLQEVNETARRWSSAPNRASQTMLYIDKLGRNSAVFESWLQLLPAGDYGSSLRAFSICGVFKIAIGAAGQYVKVEEAIFGALAEIPEIIQGAQTYVKVYSDRRPQALEKKTFDLFLAILRSLTHIMQFFAEGSIRKSFESVFKQAEYKSALLKSIDEIRKQASRIKDEAQQCLAWAVKEQSLVVKSMDTKMNRIESVDNKIDRILGSLQRLLEQRMPIPITQNANQEPVIEQLEMLKRLHPQLQQSTSKQIPCLGSISKSIEAKSYQEQEKTSTETALKLLKIIEYDPGAIQKDIESCVQLELRLDEQQKSLAAAMVRHSGYRAHMAESRCSTALLVNGRADLASADSLSPLTLVAGTLAQASRDEDSVFVLCYFCNNHRPDFMPSIAASSIGLLSSLVGQLIQQMLSRGMAIDLSSLEPHEWKKIQGLELDVLWKAFRKLTSQLPSGSVLICIIDEISRFETASLSEDTDRLARRLTRLVRNSDSIVFKLLFTCHGRALGVSQYFTAHTIDLREDTEPDDSSGWWIKMGTSNTLG